MTSIDSSWSNFLEKGDEKSFSIIYNSHVDSLYAYGISLGFQKDMCKDAIQDTFYKLYISKDQLRNVRNVAAYIFKSFKHRLIDMSRKNIRVEGLDLVAESFDVQVTILDTLIDSESAEILKKKVEELLNGLTPNQREIIYLRYMIGLGHKEIADMLDIQEESARKLLYRTMDKLRQQFSSEDFSEAFTLLLILFTLSKFH